MGNSTSGKRQGGPVAWYFGIDLKNLDDIVIDKVVLVRMLDVPHTVF